MRDRQVFEEIPLRNGMRIYFYRERVPYTYFDITVPLGHLHSGQGAIVPGEPHFLEHMLFQRSRRSPKRGSFAEAIAAAGGDTNATTSVRHTEHYLAVQNSAFVSSAERLISKVFEPLFVAEDLVIERGIQLNELQQDMWWPADNELWHYLLTEWLCDEGISQRLCFGSSEDLDQATVAHLQETHSNTYFDPATFCVLAGPRVPPSLIRKMESIQTKPHRLASKEWKKVWKRPDYHERQFANVGCPTYFLGALTNTHPTIREEMAIHFILQMVTNFSTGSLWQWGRHERGRSYHISYNVRQDQGWSVWTIEQPVNEMKDVAEARRCFLEKIEKSIKNKSMVAAEVRRRLGAEVLSLISLPAIVNAAQSELREERRITSEQESRTYIEACGDTTFLQSIFEKYFLYAQRGEFCALPIR